MYLDLNCIYWESKHPDEVKNGVQIPRQKWVFSAEYPHFPRSSSYDEHSLIPCEIEHWDLQTLQACTAALKEGKLTAAVMASPPDHLELQQRTSVSEPASGPQSINPAYQLSPKTLESNHEIEEETYDEYSLDTVKAGLIAIAGMCSLTRTKL